MFVIYKKNNFLYLYLVFIKKSYYAINIKDTTTYIGTDTDSNIIECFTPDIAFPSAILPIIGPANPPCITKRYKK